MNVPAPANGGRANGQCILLRTPTGVCRGEEKELHGLQGRLTACVGLAPGLIRVTVAPPQKDILENKQH